MTELTQILDFFTAERVKTIATALSLIGMLAGIESSCQWQKETDLTQKQITIIAETYHKAMLDCEKETP